MKEKNILYFDINKNTNFKIMHKLIKISIEIPIENKVLNQA